MSIRRIGAADAFAARSANRDSHWPRRDDPDNRFAHYADPSFRPRFVLEPGQRIFTIGSCFARGIEKALAARGFDVPTLGIEIDKREWSFEPAQILNNYVPAAIAPQIRWAFGMDRFEIGRHTAEIGAARVIDLQLPLRVRPAAAEAVLARREKVSAIYRQLASSNVVIVTLGLIEAWFDNRSGLYINSTPTRSLSEADPGRFELHILDYHEVTSALTELVDLLGEVCPAGHRIILTVSPVPLTATFTSADVAVANSYSKSVLRAAVEPFVAGRDHVEYFPSYESVVLTDRSIAFADDQVHVESGMVRFNVDRMIRRYVRGQGSETVAEIIERAREDAKGGLFGVGLKRLQQAWEHHPGDPELALALARALLRAGNGASAEALLLKHLAKVDDVAASVLLATYYNDNGRHAEAVTHAEKASELGRLRIPASIQRVIAYYHLGRLEEGLAVLEGIHGAFRQKPLVDYWKARLCDRLGRDADAEGSYRACTGAAEDPRYKVGFAEFLAARQRPQEAEEWLDRALVEAPNDEAALRLRAELRRPAGAPSAPAGGKLDGLMRWSSGLMRRAVRGSGAG